MARKPHALRKILAANVRRAAEERELPLNTLADLAGVSRSHLYALLAGERAATIDWIAKIAEVLGVEPADLLRPPVARRA